jgi:RES domain-containing protein
MTALYPRERVEAVIRPLSLASAYRIMLKSHLPTPLAVRPSKSRFCDGRTYAVLYGANDFATAFVEVVVRDRLVQSDRRVVPFGDITARGWVEFALAGDEPLNIVDLRESGCLVLGAPTDAAHARNQAAGRALSRALFEQHSDIDGVWYQSRLTGGDCLAIFDRALQRLKPVKTGQLERHPKLPDVLRTHGIRIEP